MSLWRLSGYSCWGKTPAEDQLKTDFPVSLPLSLSLCSYLPEGLSHHGIGPTALRQLWPHGNSSSGNALCSLPVSQEQAQG
jgi:hypothetical protein